MERKKLYRKFIVLLAISLTFSLVFFAASVTLASYTNSRHAQRTIATYETSGTRFSSNFLSPQSDNVKTLYVTNAAILPSAIVTVCNYEQGKQTQPYETDITYSLTVKFVRYDETEETYVDVTPAYMTANSLTAYYATFRKGETTITLNSSNVSDSTTFGRTLTASVADSDAFVLTFCDQFVTNQPNLYVSVSATPSGGYLFPIHCVFKTSLRSAGASNTWTGSFSDDTSKSPHTYAAYNYQISGEGSGTYTLRWDATKVSLDYISRAMLLAIDGATEGVNSITFPVDSDDTSRYDLRFTKVSIADSMTWVTMNSSVVTFS